MNQLRSASRPANRNTTAIPAKLGPKPETIAKPVPITGDCAIDCWAKMPILQDHTNVRAKNAMIADIEPARCCSSGLA
jgi:hypothetical protein